MRRKLLILALFACFLAIAKAPAWAGVDERVMAEISDDGKGVYTVRAFFAVPTSASTAWTVLTDYGQLGSFVPGVRSSVIRKIGCNGTLVAQESTTWILTIPKRTRVLLQVQEDLIAHRIEFVDVSLEDFELYKGTWQLVKSDSGTRIEYEASVKPRFMPIIWGRAIFLDTVRGLLRDLRKEIVRRQSASALGALVRRGT